MLHSGPVAWVFIHQAFGDFQELRTIKRLSEVGKYVLSVYGCPNNVMKDSTNCKTEKNDHAIHTKVLFLFQQIPFLPNGDIENTKTIRLTAETIKLLPLFLAIKQHFSIFGQRF